VFISFRGGCGFRPAADQSDRWASHGNSARRHGRANVGLQLRRDSKRLARHLRQIEYSAGDRLVSGDYYNSDHGNGRLGDQPHEQSIVWS